MTQYYKTYQDEVDEDSPRNPSSYTCLPPIQIQRQYSSFQPNQVEITPMDPIPVVSTPVDQGPRNQGFRDWNLSRESVSRDWNSSSEQVSREWNTRQVPSVWNQSREQVSRDWNQSRDQGLRNWDVSKDNTNKTWKPLSGLLQRAATVEPAFKVKKVKTIRSKITYRIIQMLQSNNTSVTSVSMHILRLALKIEEILYKTAPTLKIYLDTSTLRQRVRYVARRIIEKDNREKRL